MADTVRIQLRIPKSLAKRLRQTVRDFGESRDSIVVHAIRDTVEQLEYKKLFRAWHKAERERQEVEAQVLAESKKRLRRHRRRSSSRR